MSQLAVDRLRAQFGDKTIETHAFRGDDTVVVAEDVIVEVARFLRDHPELCFDMLTDMTAVDLLPAEPRFEVVYHFYSTSLKHRLRVKIRIPEESSQADSLFKEYGIANWLEREIWDMYGIRFRGHPDMRRILMYDSFEGHPLRKDYPKDKRQPLARRPEDEIARVMARRGKARSLVSENS